MAQAKGSQGQLIGGIKEATYNTTPASPAGFILPVISSSVRSTQNINSSAVIRANRSGAQPFVGNVDVSGQVVVPVDEIGMGFWLQKLLGDPTTTGAGDPYTHVFKVPSSLDSWVLEHGHTDIGTYHLFNGCKAESMEIKAGGDGELTATIGIAGGKGTTGTSSVDATPTSITFARFNNFQGAVEEGGAAVANVQEITIKLDNALDKSIYVIGGGGIRGSMPEGVVKVSGNLKAMFESWTLYNKAVNFTESSLELAFTSGTHSLTILLPEIIYARNAPALETPGGIWVELPFEAYYSNDANASSIVVTLLNAYASYPA